MTSNINALELRRRLGRASWDIPVEFGADGWLIRNTEEQAQVIVTYGEIPGVTIEAWVHASISRADRMPSYEDLAMLHHAVWQGQGYAYQVFAPMQQHVNIHEHALHLWGRLDGRAMLPEFGKMGMI